MGTLYHVPKYLFMRETRIPQELEERNQEKKFLRKKKSNKYC